MDAHGEAVTAYQQHSEEYRRLHHEALMAAANAIVMTDRKGSIIWVNPAFTRLTGYTADEVIGRNPRLMKSGEQDAAFYNDLWAVILSGQVWQGEITNRRKDGTLYVEEQTITPVRGSDGRITHFIAIKQDVTRRKDAEAAVLRQQRLLDAIFDNILAQVAYLDKDFNFVRVNASYAEGSGHGVEELIGRNHFDLFPNEENQAIFARVRDTGEPYVARAKPFIYADQPERGVTYWDWWLRPIRNPEGETEGVVLSLVDVTATERTRHEVERLNARLVDADHRKDEFLAMLSHELRNPLAAILSAVELLQRRDPTGPVREKTEGAIARQARHMARLLDDLLDVSRITYGKVTLRKERVDLNSVADQAVQSSRRIVADREHDLSIALPSEPLWLDADPDRVQQVISNLLNNAAKYTQPGGRIWLTIEREGADAVLRVRDTGIGIAPDLVHRVFDLFVQAERTPDRAQGGLGIGLTMVRGLVEMHGGSVEVRSDGVGMGSKFTVRLPAPQDSVAETPMECVPAGGADGPSRRILLVDDNEDAAEMLAALLEVDGHEVVVEHSGPAAVPAAQRCQPEVVLLDIGLPGMDGYEVARRLQQEEGLRDSVLIAVTGYGHDENRQRAQDVGFVEHLTKPVDLERLRQLLCELPSRS